MSSGRKGFRISGKVQMVIWVLVAMLVTAGSVAYIVLEKPPALWQTRYGVPLNAPPIINPVTQQPVALNDLAQNFVRVANKHSAAGKEKQAATPISLSTGIQIGMFFLTFYIVYLAFLKDPFGE